MGIFLASAFPCFPFGVSLFLKISKGIGVSLVGVLIFFFFCCWRTSFVLTNSAVADMLMIAKDGNGASLELKIYGKPHNPLPIHI